MKPEPDSGAYVAVIDGERTTLGPPQALATEALRERERVIVIRRGGGLMRYDASAWRRQYVRTRMLATVTEAGSLHWVPWLDEVAFSTWRSWALWKLRRRTRRSPGEADR